MAYHDDLLKQALQLVRDTPSTQLTLRRAVSAAYYAAFHFLIAEATSNWSNAPLRAALARAYDHGVMKTASNRILNLGDFPFTGEDPAAVASLRFVAQAFSQLQEDRHFADYNLTKDLDTRGGVDASKVSGEDFHCVASRANTLHSTILKTAAISRRFFEVAES